MIEGVKDEEEDVRFHRHDQFNFTMTTFVCRPCGFSSSSVRVLPMVTITDGKNSTKVVLCTNG